MRIGVVLPQLEIGADPAVLRDFAQTADGLGFSHLLAYDHVLGAVHADRTPPLEGPYTEKDQFHEPFTLFGYLAALTSRLELLTGVIVLPQRQTALVAKQAAEVAILSGNRLRLGLGVGWNRVEYEALGEDFASRGPRLTEQVELLRRLWTEPVVTFEGRWHRIERAGLLPRPTATIPIWFGGRSEAAYRRAARIGDGFMAPRFPQSDDPDGLRAADALARVAERLFDLTADRKTPFGLEARTELGLPRHRWRADLDRLEAAGFDRVAVNTMAAGLPAPAAHVAALEWYAAEVGLRPDSVV